MPSGMEVRNTYGSILIDSENPCLVHVNTYTESSVTYGAGFGSITITDSSPETVLAYIGNPWTTLSHVVRGAGSTRTFVFPGLVAGFPVKFYRFEAVKDIGPTYGLVLRNAAGKVTFDAAQKPGRVVQAMNSSGVLTAPTGRVYAMVMAQSAWSHTIVQYDPEDGGGLIQNHTYRQSRGNVNGIYVEFNPLYIINENSVRVPYGTTKPANETRGMALAVIMDVTNY